MRSGFIIFITLFMIFGLTFIKPAETHAQFSIIGADSGSLRLSPPNPKPDEMTEVFFESYITDLSRARIEWFVNGQKIKEGIGETFLKIKNGSTGEKTEIQIFALTEEGWPISDKLLFSSAGVSLIYEAESHTPPFYKGKARLPYEGMARVIAIPDFKNEAGEIIPPENLIFKWFRKNKLETSGQGRDSFTFRASVPMSRNEIKVEVSTFDRSYFAEGYVEFLQFSSLVNFYENHPEYGILYNKTLNGSFNLNRPEISIRAEPFFFNRADIASLTYKWILAGRELLEAGNEILLAGESSRSGSTFITAEVKSPKSFYQFASQTATIRVN